MSNARENVNLLTSTDWDIPTLRLANWGSGAVPPQVILKSSYVAGDGGGLFRYDASDTTTADNGGTVIVDAAGNRWKRQYSGPINVRWFGARGDNVTNDTAAINAAIATGAGDTIFFPSGYYVFSSGLTVTVNNTILLGEGDFNFGTWLVPTMTSGNDITFSGCQHAGIRNMYIRPTVKKGSGFAVYFTDNAFRCFAESVRVDFTHNAFGIVGATETRLNDCSARYLLGAHGVLFSGTNSLRSYRCVINGWVADNPYPQTYGTVKAWTGSTAYNLNDIVLVNNVIWQCSTAGTSAASGGPTGFPSYPGTDAFSVFTTEVPDGTAKWKFVCLAALTWITQDNYAYSLVIDKGAMINGSRGLVQTDTAATGSSYPLWAFCWDIECDHNYGSAVEQFRGEGLFINGSWIGSSLEGNGIFIDSNARGEFYVGGGTRIMGNAGNGILLNAVSKYSIIDGCFIGDNSQASAAAYHGVNVASNASDFQIVNNKIGDLVGVAGNPQAYGVIVQTGTSDNYIIANNNCLGNTTGPIIDGGSGTNKRIANNLGFNAGVSVNVTVGASPFTWTNNTGNTVTAFVAGGAVSSVTVAGFAAAAATNVSLAVPQNTAVVITYSGLPTLDYKVH